MITDGCKKLDTIAIIPARGGSKRLPRKNVLPLAGKPLIQWTLDAAKESGVIDLIAVTSDDDEVLEIAGRNEEVKIIRRPDHLATDTATSIDVVLHALSELESQGIKAKRVMLLQPTSPLRKAEDILGAVKWMDKKSAASVISVCEMEHSPLWSNQLPVSYSMEFFFDNSLSGKRSQDLPLFYRLNGAVYLTSYQDIIKNYCFKALPCYAFIMPKERSIDIDDFYDFKIASILANLDPSV